MIVINQAPAGCLPAPGGVAARRFIAVRPKQDWLGELDRELMQASQDQPRPPHSRRSDPPSLPTLGPRVECRSEWFLG